MHKSVSPQFALCLQPPANSNAFVCTSRMFDRSRKKPRWSLKREPTVNGRTFPGEDFEFLWGLDVSGPPHATLPQRRQSQYAKTHPLAVPGLLKPPRLPSPCLYKQFDDGLRWSASC